MVKKEEARKEGTGSRITSRPYVAEEEWRRERKPRLHNFLSFLIGDDGGKCRRKRKTCIKIIERRKEVK